MGKGLNYGRISWDYGSPDVELGEIPRPIFSLTPIRINHKIKHPHFSDKVILDLIKYKTSQKIAFRIAYIEWHHSISWQRDDPNEGRSFLKWLKTTPYSIYWTQEELGLNEYFLDPLAPKHGSQDELAQEYSFAIKTVVVQNRRIKLYLEDEAILSLININQGLEKDFLELVELYIKKRFLWEKWRMLSPPFLEWVKTNGLRPAFKRGQLGLNF
jgi:hypothetical protein